MTDPLANYTYKAFRIDNDLWMVKRYTAETEQPKIFDEAEVFISTEDPQIAINQAISNDTWA